MAAPSVVAADAPEVRLAPFNPTHAEAIALCFALAGGLSPGDVVFDIGCGDGRVLEWAATHFAGVTCVGYESDAGLVSRGTARILAEAGAEAAARVTLLHRDASRVDFMAEALALGETKGARAAGDDLAAPLAVDGACGGVGGALDSAASAGGASASSPSSSAAAAAVFGGAASNLSLGDAGSGDAQAAGRLACAHLLVFCYLVPTGMAFMEPQLRALLNAGARVATNMFSVRAWENDSAVEHTKRATSSGLAVHFYRLRPAAHGSLPVLAAPSTQTAATNYPVPASMAPPPP